MADKPNKKNNKRFDREQTEFERGLEDLKEEYSLQAVICVGIAIFAGCALFSGFLVSYVRYALKMQSAVYVTDILFKGIFSIVGLPLTIFMTLGIFRLIFSIRRSFAKQYHTDRDRNYQIADAHIYGSADYQDENEIEKCFFRGNTPADIPRSLYILGEGEEDHKLYALRDDLLSMNGHMVVMGTSGAGKSATLVKPMMYQAITKGKSLIVTDSKGDLYADTGKLAIKYGYDVKVLNLKASELKNSDGCDFLKPLKDDDIKADIFADTIIRNTEGLPNLDYWAKNELNGLKAFLLYVSTNKTLIKTGKNNLAEVYNLLTSLSLDEMHERFGLLDPDHPAVQAWNIFKQAEPKIQGQIINGLGIRLSVLGNRWTKHIVSADEIDLTGPMKHKCIYYVVISDMDETFKFIATLFFSLLFSEMCDLYDHTSQKARKEGKEVNLLPVDFILDEYANTGAIPAMNQKISTVRSRGIGITIILQDKGQLDSMYDENKANGILNNIPLKMLLRTTDFNTAKYFSDLMGIQTVRVENRRYDESASTIFHAKGDYTVSEGYGKRQLENPDELINSLDADHFILLIAGFHPIKLRKFLHSKHPMSKECEPLVPGEHVPEWRKELAKASKAAKEKKDSTKMDSGKSADADNEGRAGKKHAPAKNASPSPGTGANEKKRTAGDNTPPRADKKDDSGGKYDFEEMFPDDE